MVDDRQFQIEANPLMEKVLGYLNFSDGTSDPCFLGNINQLFRLLAQEPATDLLPHQRLLPLLVDKLEELHPDSPAFRQIDQVQAVLPLAFDLLPKAYLEHHRDMLFHQSGKDLFNSFLIARMAGEAE